MMRRLSLVLMGAMLSGCATTAGPVKKATYDFGRVKRVALGTFTGLGGTEVGREFVKQLLASGFVVTDKPQTADAVLSGTVTDYRALNQMLVFLGTATFPGPKDAPIEIVNPIVSGEAQTSEATALTLPKTQMMMTTASVGVNAQLNDVKTGDLIWANSYSYEGLNMPSAIHIVAGTLASAIHRLVLGAHA